MNKIYKVIWSKVRNCYVAVSEIAKRNGKSCTSVNCGAKANRGHAGVALAVAIFLSMTGGGVAWGADQTITDKSDSRLTVTNTTDAHKDDIYRLNYTGFNGSDSSRLILTVTSTGQVGYIISQNNGNTITVNGGGKVNNGTIITPDAQFGDWFAGVFAGMSNNIVNIEGNVAGGVYGGFSSTGAVSSNSVTVSGSGASVGRSVYGGAVKGYNAQSNTVTIKDGEKKQLVKYEVYGGYSSSLLLVLGSSLLHSLYYLSNSPPMI